MLAQRRCERVQAHAAAIRVNSMTGCGVRVNLFTCFGSITLASNPAMVLSRAATRDGSDLERATSFKAGSRQSDAYLSELLSYSLDRLRKVRETLARGP